MTVRLRDDGRFMTVRQQSGALAADNDPNTTPPAQDQILESRATARLACYWDGTGGTVATDTVSLQVWVKDGIQDLWVLGEEASGMNRRGLVVLRAYDASQIFLRIANVSGTPTDAFVRACAIYDL